MLSHDTGAGHKRAEGLLCMSDVLATSSMTITSAGRVAAQHLLCLRSLGSLCGSQLRISVYVQILERRP